MGEELGGIKDGGRWRGKQEVSKKEKERKWVVNHRRLITNYSKTNHRLMHLPE